MLRRLLFRVAGLCLSSVVGLAVSAASELDGKSPVPSPTRPIAKQPAPKKDEGGCGSHGTRVEFHDTPSEAAKIAKKEQKLVFVLHVSGNFEDPRFT